MLRATLRRWWTDRGAFASVDGQLLWLYDGLIRAFPWRRWPWRGRLVSVRVTGSRSRLHLRLGGSDFIVAGEVFGALDYGPASARGGDVRLVLDLGANVGISMRYFAERFPEALVIGVEPDEDNLAVARRNLAAAGLGARARLIRACVAARPGTAHLRRTGLPCGFRMVEAPGPSTVAVAALTVDAILAQVGAEGPIDLLKCDVEGAEAEIFGACGAWIQRVRSMIVEVHRGAYSLDRLEGDLARAGYPRGTLTERPSLHHTMVVVTRAAG